MQLKTGAQLRSSCSDTEVIVIKAPAGDVDLLCGGHPMIPKTATPEGGEVDPKHEGPTLMGKRYANDDIGIEILCTKPGLGSLSIGPEDIPQKAAKALPASD